MDFDKLLRDADDLPPTNPRELYEQLPFKAKDYGYIRDAQTQILTKWDDKREQRDIVIKVNTGGGKTIDGLVILQSYLNEGIQPALYVAPNKFLVEQVVKEADNLGIPVVTDPEAPAYLAGEAIAVVNGAKLFNGRTVFSDNRPSAPRVPIGAVVIDDAHAVLAILKDQLSVTIERSNPTFTELLDLFEEDLKTQAPDVLLDIRDATGGGFARVPFWALSNKLDQVRTILRQYKPDNEFDYGVDSIRDSLALCRIVFTPLALTIVPPVPPVGRVHSFAEAQRRVFLTATLANDSALITDFDADPALVSEPIQPLTAGDIGERMILAPQEINSTITEDNVRAEIAKLSEEYNTLVIVPSERAVEKWSAYSPTIATKHNLTNIIASMQSKNHVGLVIAANRYDGIDLPDDACRILVIDGLPQAFSGDERLESLMQRTVGGVDDRQVQRLEQGMGRAVRSNEDHCLVFLIGRRLAQLTVDPRTLERFSPATQAQLKASRVMAKNLDSQPLSKIMETAWQSLTRDSSWVKYAKSQLRSLIPSPARVDASAIEMRRAFDEAFAGDLEGGSTRLATAAEACVDPRQAGQILEQAAAYAERYNPTQAQKLLAEARSTNLYVLQPMTGITYRPLTFTDSQAAKVAQRATSMFGTPQALRVAVEGILDRLQFDPTATEEFEEAVLELGLFLGIGSQRPERELGQGPDNLWAIDPSRFWVIEVKSGAVSEFISKRDSGQLGEATQWFRRKYPADQAATPVMIHRARKLHKTASGPTGMQVIDSLRLSELKSDVRKLAEGLATIGWSDLSEVARLLNGHKLDAAGLMGRLVAATGGTV